MFAQVDVIFTGDAGKRRCSRAGEYALPHAGFELLHEYFAAHSKH